MLSCLPASLDFWAPVEHSEFKLLAAVADPGFLERGGGERGEGCPLPTGVRSGNFKIFWEGHSPCPENYKI